MGMPPGAQEKRIYSKRTEIQATPGPAWATSTGEACSMNAGLKPVIFLHFTCIPFRSNRIVGMGDGIIPDFPGSDHFFDAPDRFLHGTFLRE